MVRETHAPDLGAGETARTQTGFSWSDGSGREIQRKAQADRDHRPEWVATGWTD